jgi:hypothetical protein
VAYPSQAKRKAALEWLRRICLALPETSERRSHGAPSFFVRDKKCFLMLLDDHHGDGRFAIWCAAPPGNQELLIAANAGRFFRPPYVGHRGWLGVLLNDGVDWDELEGIVEDAFASVAPKSLLSAYATANASCGFPVSIGLLIGSWLHSYQPPSYTAIRCQPIR